MKKKKIALFSALTIVILLCLLAFLFVNMGKNTEGAKQYKEEIKQQSAQMTEDLMSEIDLVTVNTKNELEGGVVSGSSIETELEGENTHSEQEGASQHASSGGQAVTASNLSEAEKKALLTESLKSKYYDILLSQKAEAIAMVNQLVAQGKADYVALKSGGGWNTTAKAKLMSDYMSRVSAMETEMDGSFAQLVSRMEQNLTDAGLDAAPMIESFKNDYSTIKEENRKAFMDQLFAQIKNKG